MTDIDIYPYGQGGELPAGISLTDSLDENVSNKGASAKAAYNLKRMIGTSASHWNGKKWYGFGTSITDTSGNNPTGKYAPYLAALSGMTFVNKGHGGGGITTYSNQAVYNDIMSASLADADLITVEVGANEGNALLGTIYDGLTGETVTDNSTICGALNKCLQHLLSTTNAQIVVFPSAHQRYWQSNVYDGNEKYANNYTVAEMEKAIEEVCRLNSVYFIKGAGACGMGFARLNGSSGNNYVVDNIHQTNLGGYNFAQAIWSQLKNIPLFYTQIPT